MGGGAVRMRGMVEANRLADDPEPAYPSSVSLREPPVGGSHAIRLHPQGEKGCLPRDDDSRGPAHWQARHSS